MTNQAATLIVDGRETDMRLDKAVPRTSTTRKLGACWSSGSASPPRAEGRGPSRAMDYPVETFSDEERALLEPHFTNLDRPVFALVNLPRR